MQNLMKRRGSTVILDSVSFTARPGRVTGFVGPNGAGKSSTLRILLGLDKATTGTALIKGRRYRDILRPLLTVGALLDDASPLPDRRVASHLKWVAQSNGIAQGRVHETLAQVELQDAAKLRVGTLSLGMKQRLGLAAALLGEPSILVLDEPVNGLDPDGIRWIRTFLRQYASRGNTVLVSSHLMSEMAATADDIVVINQGRIVSSGTLAAVTSGFDSLEDAFFSLTGRAVADNRDAD
ncbi:ABC transporter ATP-binding protein [Cryobacterium sp. Y50]|uniref:ABC transporter ATP-binding protein n=1 Tax=Cryobacterium sp. Y50 TaxID=2048286 RepID=UPI001E2AFCDB|nr:ATP-binding cassette domain-containing protein [Cryobacterium sp. Y50]